MTQFYFVVSPVVFLSIISLIKYCITRFARYQELKLLNGSRVKHAVIAKDHIYFE